MFIEIEHAVLHNESRLQDHFFSTPSALAGKTLGHAAKGMLGEDTRILLDRGQRRLKENVAAELS